MKKKHQLILFFISLFFSNFLFASSLNVFDLSLYKLNLLFSSNKNEKIQENFITKVQSENFLTNDLIITDSGIYGFFTFDYSYLENVDCQFLKNELFESLKPKIINFPIYIDESKELIYRLNNSFTNSSLYDVATSIYGLNYYCFIKKI